MTLPKTGLQKRVEKIREKPLIPDHEVTVQVGGKSVRLPGTIPDYLPPGYDAFPDIENVPNIDKLSRFERSIMNALPGIAESGVGQALAKFGDSWAGKMLSYLDVGAEALERATGFVTQAAFAVGDPKHQDEFNNSLGAAWYAGSLAADFANLPRYNKDTGRMEFPTDLPGVEGLVDARRQIHDLTSQGVDPGEALIQVRDEYYDSLGALALRSQLHDLLFHVAGDPINILFPYLKPIERLKGFQVMLGKKVFPSKAVQVADTLRFTSQHVDELRDAVVIAENIGDVEEIARLGKLVVEAEQELRWSKEFAEYAIKNKMSPIEEKLARIFRVQPDEAVTGVAALKLNPFTMTPGSRAHELMNTVLTNITTRLLAKGGDPASWTRSIVRAADGLFTPEFAAHIITAEGRATRAGLQGASIEMQKLLSTFNKLEDFESPLLRRIGDVLDTHPANIVERLRDGEEALVATQVLEKIAASPDEFADVIRMMEGALLPLDEAGMTAAIGRLKIFEEAALWSDEVFQLEAANKVIDAVAQMAIAQFGIKARGAVYKFADAVKAAESLAFLKMNPAYPMRNLFNNFFTTIGRGHFGNIRPGYYDDLFKNLKLPEPPRFRVGVGFADLPVEEIETGGIAQVLQRGSEIVRDLEMGDAGRLDRFTRWVNKRQGLGFGKLAQRFEQMASVRAYGATFTNYMRQSHHVGKGIIAVEEFSPALARALGPEQTKALENIVSSNWSASLIDEALFAENANLNTANILSEASQRSGMKIENILGADYTEQIGQSLVDAAKKGSPAVRAEVKRVRKFIQAHIDEQVNEAKTILVQQTAARVNAEGAGALPLLLSESMDEFYGSNFRNAMDMTKVGDWVKGLDDPALRGRFWDNLFAENDAFYKRQWDFFDSRMTGAKQGLDDAMARMRIDGTLTPNLERTLTGMQDDITSTFGGWRDGWQEFYNRRTELFQELKKVTGKKQRAAKWDAITDELDRKYALSMGSEEEFLRRMDNVFAQGLPDAQKEMFLSYRNRIAAFRGDMREATLDFRRNVRELSAQGQEEAYQLFWKDRMDRLARLQQEEKATKVALMGDRRAQDFMGMSEAEANALGEAKGFVLEGFSPEKLQPEQRQIFERFLETRAKTGEYQRLHEVYGEFSLEKVDGQFRLWRGDMVEPEEAVEVAGNLHIQIRDWVEKDADHKDVLVRLLEDNPEAGKEIQDFAQWWLREQGFDDVRLYSGKLRLKRGERIRRLEDFNPKAWDSYSGSEHLARRQAGADGFVIEVEFPVDNIFTHTRAHPGFDKFAHETEFILNEVGYENARVISINGVEPTASQMEILRGNLPELRGGPSDNFPTMVDFHAQTGIKPELLMGKGIDDLWFNRGSRALDAIEEATQEIMAKPPVKLDVSGEARNLFDGYISRAKRDQGEVLYGAYRMGEWGRDSALLNYNRRMNYDNWVGVVVPYEFWVTHTAFNWALHSIDRPAMLTNYLRMKKFANTAFRPEEGFPGRLRGSFRIPMPFMPDYMGGDLFVNPMNAALPFDQFTYAFEQYQSDRMRDEGKAERVLEELLNDGRITEQQYSQAMDSREGDVWERAVTLGRLDDTEERRDPFDFMSMLVSPHAPLMWAHELARGTPENIRPFLPITRSVKAATGILGIPSIPGGINPEGAVRRALGLPAFDQWDDYRIDRMLSNMAADGTISTDESLRAMISREGTAFNEARRRAGVEYGWGAMGSITGIPTRAYPEGEEILRNLKSEYEGAWSAYEAGDANAMQRFYNENPEYETRLALWKNPEERLKNFLVGELWDTWHDMPKLHQIEVRRQLGDLFQNAFISKETRATDAIPIDTLQVWLKIMGGDPPGQVTFTETLTPIELAPVEVAHAAQAFYNTRSNVFQYNDVVWPLQKDYFSLTKGSARKAFIREHPILQQYWDWRRDFMERNPSVAPYIEDDPDKLPKYPSEQALIEAEEAQPDLRWFEWQTVLTPALWRLVRDNLRYGDSLLDSEVEELQDFADGMGLGFDELMLRLDEAYQEEEGALANAPQVP